MTFDPDAPEEAWRRSEAGGQPERWTAVSVDGEDVGVVSDLGEAAARDAVGVWKTPGDVVVGVSRVGQTGQARPDGFSFRQHWVEVGGARVPGVLRRVSYAPTEVGGFGLVTIEMFCGGFELRDVQAGATDAA